MRRIPWLALLLPLLLLAFIPFTRAAVPQQMLAPAAYLPLVYQGAGAPTATTAPTSTPTATATATRTATATSSPTSSPTATNATAPAPAIVNAGFEDAGGWQTSGQASLVQEAFGGHNSSGFAQLGGNQGDGAAAISQTVTVPADYPLLYFYHERRSAQVSCVQDAATVRVDGQAVATIRNFCAAQLWGYEVAIVDLSAYVGQTVTISFALNYTPATSTYWRLDDVSFQ